MEVLGIPFALLKRDKSFLGVLTSKGNWVSMIYLKISNLQKVI
jgi:hypothetical protein